MFNTAAHSAFQLLSNWTELFLHQPIGSARVNTRSSHPSTPELEYISVRPTDMVSPDTDDGIPETGNFSTSPSSMHPHLTDVIPPAVSKLPSSSGEIVPIPRVVDRVSSTLPEQVTFTMDDLCRNI